MENKQAFPILRELRQGDWVNSARLQGEAAKCLSEEKRFENGFVILTQTCDVVSPSKERILLAPVFAVDSQTADDIWRGRRPTKIPLKLIPPELKDGNDWVVDATFAFSLNKQVFEQSYRFYHCVDVNSSEEVSAFSNRIGRVFTRFPFPDEVHDCLRKIQSKVRAAEGKDTKPLAGFLDLTRTIQVSCDDWSKPERQLHFVFVMRSDVINYSEDDGIIKFDSLTKEQVNLEKYGVKKCSRDPKNMSFSDLCSLICFLAGQDSRDNVVLASLIEGCMTHMGEFIFGDISKYEPEVKTVKFDWKPSKEYSIDEMDRSYSLDLEVLSDSHFGDDS